MSGELHYGRENNNKVREYCKKYIENVFLGI
jgi:hypothetical protein